MKDKKGTTEECIRHYASTLPPPASKNVSVARRPLVEFCGVHRDTVSRWLLGGKLPVGGPLLKLRFFLEQMGYCVTELVKLPEALYKLGEMIAYDAISLEDATSSLQFTEVQSTYRLVLGKSDTTRDRVVKIEAEWESRKDAIASKRNEWAKRLGLNGQASSVQDVPEAVSPKTQAPKSISLGRTSELEVLGYLVLAALPLADKIVSNEFSAEDRRNLRDMTGGDAVFRLSNLLEALCGEKARAAVLANSHKSTVTSHSEDQ